MRELKWGDEKTPETIEKVCWELLGWPSLVDLTRRTHRKQLRGDSPIDVVIAADCLYEGIMHWRIVDRTMNIGQAITDSI